MTFEDILPRDRSVRYPTCLAGEGRCPAEDCSGVYGYEDLVRVLADPEGEEDETMLEWIGGSCDASAFDPQQVHLDDPHKRWKIALEEE